MADKSEMTEADLQYLFLRLGIKATQPAGRALHRVYMSGLPFGAAARECRIPPHRLEPLWRQAEQIRYGFTVTAEDVDVAGVGHVNASDANEILAYQRQREVALANDLARVAALRAAGLTNEQIARLK